MRFVAAGVILVLVAAVGCVPVMPPAMSESRALFAELSSDGAQTYFPDEYRNLSETLAAGDRFLKEERREDARQAFELALLKGELLRERLPEEKRLREQAALLNAEAEKREKERLDAERLLKAAAEAKEQADALKKGDAASQPVREKPLPAIHVVRRGETLIDIAAKPEIYNDGHLWPLIYRANRDQIKDPKALSSGQTLRIPRNASRDEIAEARRYAHDRPLF